MAAQLHVITDTTHQQRWSHWDLARMAFAGGADVVQYRKKDFDLVRDLFELRQSVKLAGPNQRLILNDHVAGALQSGAMGVHLGKEDMQPGQARLILGPAAWIGATVHNFSELDSLREAPIDYIGVGPVFGTQSKNTGLPPLGLIGLRNLVARSPWPVIAIGAISVENARSVIDCGVAGIAVLSSICLADNPQYATEQFRNILG